MEVLGYWVFFGFDLFFFNIFEEVKLSKPFCFI